MARNRKYRKDKGNNNKSENDHSKENNNGTNSQNSITPSSDDNSKEVNDTKAKGYNDPAWYTRFPELAFGAGNLPYSEPFGSLLKHKNIAGSLAIINSVDQVCDPDPTKFDSVGGLVSMHMHPSYGLSYDRNHPLNVAAQMFYTNVRYVNSGRKNYEAVDLMIYALAISELYSFIMYCQRLYGYAYMYSQRNYFVGSALIEANGVIPGNIRANLANFRYWLNAFINKVSSFAVPADIMLFSRRIFMFAHLYTESQTANIKDQLYQFVPDGFYKFTLDASGKGMLGFEKFQTQLMDVPTIMAYGENLLSEIFGDEDFGLMSGDIIKAYGSNIVGLTSLPEEVVIVPEYEEFVLSQFKNATLVGEIINKWGTTDITYTVSTDSTVHKAGDICQDGKGNLIAINVINGNEANHIMSTTMDHIMSVTNPMPDINDNFECSRLIVGSELVDTNVFTFTDVGTEKQYRRYLVCGSDFATKATICRFVYDANGQNGTNTAFVDIVSNFIYHALADLDKGLLCAQFKWSPILVVAFSSTSGSTNTWNQFRLASSVDNYTFVSNSILQRLHEAALLSLTFVPGVSKVIG